MTLPERARVFVIGSGAREHALIWKLAQSDYHPQLFVAPGNPGMEDLATCISLKASEVDAIVQFAEAERMDFVVVGPEAPLGAGLVDALTSAGIPAFGPNQAAAQLETSKVFAKQLMRELHVPTASYEIFTNATEALAHVREQGTPIVIKADGLAAGKGVVVAQTLVEAEQAINDMMVEQKFGAAGNEILIESLLVGAEASLMFFVDSQAVVPMIPAQDHKRIGDGDTGPNTGGMGAFAPIPGRDTAALQEQVLREIVEPILAALKQSGIVYRGVLYVGLMLTAEGPQVIEFNARFGDPEAEVVLPLLDGDLLDILWAVAHDELDAKQVVWRPGSAVCVVLATPGYPEGPIIGQEIEGLDTVVQQTEVQATEVPQTDASEKAAHEHGPAFADAQVVTFHAGTTRMGEKWMTAGGRVLTVAAAGASHDEARHLAYEAAQRIYFEGMQMRYDIGKR